MSSLRKIASARANGAKSKGPKTPEGKRKSSMNALSHGLTAENVILNNESKEEFEHLLQVYRLNFQPQGELETDLVDQMVGARWRQARYWQIEAALFDVEVVRQESEVDGFYTGIDEPCRLALAFRALAADHSLDLISRYETRLRRIYERSLHELRAAQAARGVTSAAEPKQNLPNEPSPKNGHSPAPPESPATPPEPADPEPERNLPNEPNPKNGHSPAQVSQRPACNSIPPIRYKSAAYNCERRASAKLVV